MESSKEDPVSAEVLLKQQEKKYFVYLFVTQMQYVMLSRLLHVSPEMKRMKQDGWWT